MTQTKQPLQPRMGLIAGAIIFLAFSVVPTINYFNTLNEGKTPSAGMIAWVVTGFTTCAILAYWATRFDASKTRFTRRDALLTLVLAVVTGSALSVGLWLAA